MAIVLALFSSLIWGTADFGGGLFTRRIHPIKTVALSQLGGLVAIGLVWGVLLASGATSVPTGPTIWWGIAAGVAGSLGLVCFYAALALGSMGVVSPIAAMGALVPVVIGVLGGEHLGLVTGLGVALALVGVVLASGPELGGGVSRLPLLLAVLAALGFGLVLVLLHRASTGGVVPALLVMRLASVLVLFGIWAIRRRQLPDGQVRRRDLPGLALVGCGDLAANGLFAAASGLGMLAIVSMLGSLYPVVTIVLAAVLLHERLRPVQWIGAALALTGVCLLTI